MNTAETITAPHLEVKGVNKRFGTTEAVRSASLEVMRGETLALLGPSGCGKTTLLRVIAGLEMPDDGIVFLGGTELTGPGSFVAPEKRRIGMVFQGGALFPHMTVGVNVAYGLRGSSELKERTRAALELVDLVGFDDRMPESLSGGQAQRVALARALAPEPDVLLLDEPFASLDAELRIRVRGEVASLLRDLSITAVFVTHDQEEAFVVGDQVAVMREGSVVQVGTPGEVYERPASPWIAAFVGDANIVRGKATGSEAATAIGPVPLVSDTFGWSRVVVRPEHIEVGPGDIALIEGVEFYGHDTAYQIAINGTAVVARAMTTPRFARGDRVGLSYSGPPAVAFADPDPAAWSDSA